MVVITGRAQPRGGCVMKRLGLALVSIAALGLTACQGHSPTGPSEAPAVAAVNGVLNDDSEDSYVKARLTANPSTISAGQTSTLTWTSSNARYVYLDGVAVAKSGSKNVSPRQTKTYTLVATNPAGSATDTSTVTVTATPPPPAPMPTALLIAMGTSIQSGQSTQLQWSTSNAATITLDGSPVSANGSRTVSPTATTTYTLDRKSVV